MECGDKVATIVRGLEWLLGAQPQRSDKTRDREEDLRGLATVLEVDIAGNDSVDRITHRCRVHVERDISRIEDELWVTNDQGASERDLALHLFDTNINAGQKDRRVASFRNAGGDAKARRRLRNEFVRKVANLLADLYTKPVDVEPLLAGTSADASTVRSPWRRRAWLAIAIAATLSVGGVGLASVTGNDEDPLDVTILDLTVECRGQQVVTEVARVRNFRPVEQIRYKIAPPPTGPVVATSADTAGERAVFWWCDPSDAGDSVEIEVVGIETGRSVVLSIDMVVAGT